MAEQNESTSSNPYHYFDMCRTEETIKQNHQEIEQAIDSVTRSKLDEKIQRIWKRLLK